MREALQKKIAWSIRTAEFFQRQSILLHGRGEYERTGRLTRAGGLFLFERQTTVKPLTLQGTRALDPYADGPGNTNGIHTRRGKATENAGHFGNR